MTMPRNDADMWAVIQPIIAEGWDDAGLVADSVVTALDVIDDAEAERIRAWADRVLIERSFNMMGG